MKKLPLITFFTLLIPFAVYTQEISSSLPNSNFKGESDTIYVTASGTHFQQGITTVDLGSEITIHEVVVTSTESLFFWITIEVNAQIGDRELYITTDLEVVNYPNAFEVLDPGEFEVVLTVIPTDPLYLSSFDPDDPANSPMVFLVDIFNNETERDYVTVEFILSNDEYGKIGSATKDYEELASGAHENFDNRQFDEYDIESTAGALLDEAMQTGMLPPGTYNYTINVYDDGAIIGYDIGVNIVTNQIASIDLIGPGNIMYDTPEVVFTPNPYFQWFSVADDYDFSLYEVMKEQTSPDEVTTNLPIFTESKIIATQFLYPTSGEQLEVGKTYAWQVRAHFAGSMGQEPIYSDVFWFQFGLPENIVVKNIKVYPQELTLDTNSYCQFKAEGYDENNIAITITDDCEWKVISEIGGTISSLGLFHSNSFNEPKTVAVKASYHGIYDYCTVTIVPNYLFGTYDFNIYKFVCEIFGIPYEQKQ
jgi:hypothetical protein